MMYRSERPLLVSDKTQNVHSHVGGSCLRISRTITLRALFVETTQTKMKWHECCHEVSNLFLPGKLCCSVLGIYVVLNLVVSFQVLGTFQSLSHFVDLSFLPEEFCRLISNSSLNLIAVQFTYTQLLGAAASFPSGVFGFLPSSLFL